jgi:hypothetical protein
MEQNTAKDFIGQELKVGDWVVFPQKGYRNLLAGKVISLSPKTALIRYIDYYSKIDNFRQLFEQLIKVEESKVPDKYKKINLD